MGTENRSGGDDAFHIHLSTDEINRADEARALLEFLATGRGDYRGNCYNTHVENNRVGPIDDRLELPRVILSGTKAEIKWRNNTYCNIPLNAVLALKAIIEAFPGPAGLKPVVGDHPERAIAQLPIEICPHVVPVAKRGYRWSLDPVH